MGRALVAYFSASGVTAKLAKRIAEMVNGDLFEIRPVKPYTKSDLNWMDRQSRSSNEMKDENARPPIVGECGNIDEYSTIYLGYPIWWYLAPRIVNTFLEKHDLKGKKIYVFVTSGGSKLGEAANCLKVSCPDSEIVEGKVLNDASDSQIMDWLNSHRK